MVNKAFDNDKISCKPLKAFRRTKRKLTKGSNTRKRTVSVNEYHDLLKYAAEYLRPILVVLYNTGMRVGEARTLCWSYVDFENGFIRLPGSVTKEGREKAIPLNHHVEKYLMALRPSIKTVDDAHPDFIFTYLGLPIKSPWGIRKSFMTACKDAGIICGQDGLLPKDIRRTVKTNMAAAGVSKVYRDSILGHTLKGMDVHYIQPSEKDLTVAMEKYTHWLANKLAIVDHNVDQEGIGEVLKRDN